MDESFEFKSRRSPVFGLKGIVAASQPLAVAAGMEILKLGGNAADAAIATAAALNVTEPGSTGIGGDCFALFFEAKTKKIHALNGSGRAPQTLSLKRLKVEGFGDELPEFHPYTITVPGACAGWFDLVERFGCLSMQNILHPAIRMAEEGFPVSPVTSHYWRLGAKKQLKQSQFGHELTIDGNGPKPGEIFKNTGLARTFSSIAKFGREYFYQGEIAERIIKTVQQAGGCLTMDDLNDHYSTWEEPISTSFRGLRLWECPPNGQGLAALLALNILEEYDLEGMPAISTQRLHLEIEAMRLAFADTRWYVTDPEFASIPVSDLLSKEYARERRKLVDIKKARIDQTMGRPITGSDTVYFSVVDGQGNACSFINSNYMGFGTGIVPEGCGFSLQNRGHNFSLDEKHPNVIHPGKRPYHTIIPALITREADNSLFATMGVMGGFMQPQGHLQVFLGQSCDNLDPQECLDLPRFCIEDGTAGGIVALEEGISGRVVNELAGMGHKVRPVKGMDRSLFGRGQIIQRDQNTGVLCAGSDPRADGCAMCVT